MALALLSSSEKSGSAKKASSEHPCSLCNWLRTEHDRGVWWPCLYRDGVSIFRIRRLDRDADRVVVTRQGSTSWITNELASALKVENLLLESVDESEVNSRECSEEPVNSHVPPRVARLRSVQGMWRVMEQKAAVRPGSTLENV